MAIYNQRPKTVGLADDRLYTLKYGLDRWV